jgi:hypothetical protein
MQKQATITSKGQITVPREVLFENDEGGIRVRPVRSQSAFSKYRGIGNPGIGSGRRGIARWVREIRGQ